MERIADQEFIIITIMSISSKTNQTGIFRVKYTSIVPIIMVLLGDYIIAPSMADRVQR